MLFACDKNDGISRRRRCRPYHHTYDYHLGRAYLLSQTERERERESERALPPPVVMDVPLF